MYIHTDSLRKATSQMRTMCPEHHYIHTYICTYIHMYIHTHSPRKATSQMRTTCQEHHYLAEALHLGHAQPELYLYVCIYVCMYVCMCVSLYCWSTILAMLSPSSICMYVCMYVYMYLCVEGFAMLSLGAVCSTCTCVYVCMHVCMFTCDQSRHTYIHVHKFFMTEISHRF